MGKSNITFETASFLRNLNVGVSDIKKVYSGKTAKSIGEAIGQAILETTAAITFEVAVNAAKDASEYITPEAMPFHNITGNLYRSIGFLITRYDKKKGRAMRNRTVTPATINHAKPATRPSLRKGERYELPKNYLGDLSGYSEHKSKEDYETGTTLGLNTPFVGRVGGGNYTGNEMRKQAIREFMGNNVGKFSDSLWRCYAFVSMPYINFVNRIHDMNLGLMVANAYRTSLRQNGGINLRSL